MEFFFLKNDNNVVDVKYFTSHIRLFRRVSHYQYSVKAMGIGETPLTAQLQISMRELLCYDVIMTS